MIKRAPVDPHVLLAILNRFFGDYFDNACDLICRVDQDEFRMAYADHVVPPVYEDDMDSVDRDLLRSERELDGMEALGQLDHVIRIAKFIDLGHEIRCFFEDADGLPAQLKTSELPQRLY